MKSLLFNKKGFTLMEILVVLAIFAVLAGIVLPNVLNSIGKGERTAALEEEHNVVVAIGAAMKMGNGTVVAYSTSGKIPAKSGSGVADNDPGKYLINATEFEWTITENGVLAPGNNNPLND
ncbi:type II secretion system protein [Dehalogenimonas alkenigignens]|uniref:type II secretion system protein n=1 Tax=Dehalogenimonas alkenigignens TaxID=1217799 RepID=UPI000D582D6F|nr:type II secretion system protein [Dehalogenimonas alkenigignens]PVV84406.1 general secretion pathway protein [Dehalogenimonas alkenigignens]